MTIEQDQELTRLAYDEVAKPTYPEPTATLEEEIKVMIEKRDVFHAGTLEEMPSDTALRTELHDEINTDVDALTAENARIIAANRTARVAVDLAYENAIESFIEDPTNLARVDAILEQRKRDSDLGTMQWQLSQILQAYQEAQMLGDDISMAETRAEYQTLLDEYNTKLGAV